MLWCKKEGPGYMKTWGGKAWRRFIDEAFAYLGDLEGKHVLELGFGDGSICREFALRGAAQVTGVDLDQRHLATAGANTQGLPVTFFSYNGDLKTVTGSFDVIFTKSVLVATDLEHMLEGIRERLKPGGRFAFIENGRGGLLGRAIRYCVRGSRHRMSYFTQKHIDLIRSRLRVEVLRRVDHPPVYLVCGCRENQ
jgi:SAM-dependent methyltransferase